MGVRYKNILVASDGSKQSEAVIKEAVTIAKRNEALLNIPAGSDVLP